MKAKLWGVFVAFGYVAWAWIVLAAWRGGQPLDGLSTFGLVAAFVLLGLSRLLETIFGPDEAPTA